GRTTPTTIPMPPAISPFSNSVRGRPGDTSGGSGGAGMRRLSVVMHFEVFARGSVAPPTCRVRWWSDREPIVRRGSALQDGQPRSPPQRLPGQLDLLRLDLDLPVLARLPARADLPADQLLAPQLAV